MSPGIAGGKGGRRQSAPVPARSSVCRVPPGDRPPHLCWIMASHSWSRRIPRRRPTHAARASRIAGSLVGSEILKIAADVRALAADGREVCNLTVGDFAPSEFRIPDALEHGIVDALHRGETNYPPSDGMLALREAVRALYERELGFTPALESVIVTGGSRPGIYATYRALVDPGDRVVYPAPSWNNNHYVHLVGAEGVRGGDATRRRASCRRARRSSARCAARDCSRSARRSTRPARRSPPTRCATSASWCVEENARRGAGRAAALPDVRPGVLDAHLRRDAARASRSACARGRAVHDLRRRHLEGVRRHRRARRAGSSRRPTSPAR